MLIVKRTQGGIVAKHVATEGKVTKVVVAAQAEAAAATAPKVKKGKAPRAAKAAKSEDAAPKDTLPKDASPGAKLAFKLNRVIEMTSDDPEIVKDRNALAYKLGKLANEIGPGDPDVAAAHEKARADQARFRSDGTVRNAAEGADDAFYSWSAAFIAGYHAKVNAKGTTTPKPYKLIVSIAGQAPVEGRKLDAVESEEHVNRYASFGDAHRAAVRWFTLKSDIAHLISAKIETLDLANSVPGEDPLVVDNLTYNVTLAEARDAYQAAQRRQDRGPITFSPKIGGRTLGFGVKVKESRCEFSRG